MKEKEVKLVKSLLGEDFFEKLEKSDLYKLNTKTALNIEEIKISMQIVPRAILAWLFNNLKPMARKEIKKINFPFCDGYMNVNKIDFDVYNGTVCNSKNEVVYEFQYRSLPGIGLIILSSFELYDINNISEGFESEKEEFNEKAQNLQDIIDERFKLQEMIENVVERKISQREAIQQMILNRLSVDVNPVKMIENYNPVSEDHMENKETKKLKLQKFLEERKQKKLFEKNEVKCPDCRKTLMKSNDTHVTCCVCFGEFRNKSFKINKSESGKVIVELPNDFGRENKSMLMEAFNK